MCCRSCPMSCTFADLYIWVQNTQATHVLEEVWPTWKNWLQNSVLEKEMVSRILYKSQADGALLLLSCQTVICLCYVADMLIMVGHPWFNSWSECTWGLHFACAKHYRWWQLSIYRYGKYWYWFRVVLRCLMVFVLAKAIRCSTLSSPKCWATKT